MRTVTVAAFAHVNEVFQTGCIKLIIVNIEGAAVARFGVEAVGGGGGGENGGDNDERQ